MHGNTKTWFFIGILLVILGAVLFAAVMTIGHWDFKKLGTVKYQTTTYRPREGFHSIAVTTDTADISFVLAEDGKCQVTCHENERALHTVAVQNGTLTISLKDERKWYEHIGFSFDTPKITVALPVAEYDTLLVKESTGDVDLAAEFTFKDIDITASTGDILVKNVSAGAVRLAVSTGHVTVRDVTCAGDLAVCVTTGKAALSDVTCQNLTSTGNTGDVELRGVAANGTLWMERTTGDVEFERCDAQAIRIKTDTGDVDFERCDAQEIFINTDTGDVEGSLLSEKVFLVKTDTGRVRVPNSVTGGRCEITTDTGDVKITLQ